MNNIKKILIIFGLLFIIYQAISILLLNVDKLTKYIPENTLILRELTENEKLTLHLYHKIDGDNNYKLYRKMKDVINCESDWNPTATGDNGKAYSICQFHRTTFEEFKQLSGLTETEYENPYDQITVMSWAYKNNLEHHWTCDRLVDTGKYLSRS